MFVGRYRTAEREQAGELFAQEVVAQAAGRPVVLLRPRR